MNPSRRDTLRLAGGAGLCGALASAGLLGAPEAAAQGLEAAVFKAQGLAAGLEAMGAKGAVESKGVQLIADDVAENGASVTIGIRSTLPGTQMIALLVDKNPTALVAAFEIPEGTEPDLRTRIKMAQTSSVVALVKAGGKFHFARKEIKVTAGGC